jgi:hypothetical protein
VIRNALKSAVFAASQVIGPENQFTVLISLIPHASKLQEKPVMGRHFTELRLNDGPP